MNILPKCSALIIAVGAVDKNQSGRMGLFSGGKLNSRPAGQQMRDTWYAKWLPAPDFTYKHPGSGGEVRRAEQIESEMQNTKSH